MGRYKRIILLIYENDLESLPSIDDFVNQITTRFLRMIHYNTVTVDVEIYVSKIVDAIIKNIESFVNQAMNQSDEEFDRWFSVWLYRTMNNYAKKFIRFCQVRNKLTGDDVELDDEKKFPAKVENDLLSSLIEEEFFSEFVKTLNEKETEVLKLKLQDYKQKQIAEMLGISEATVSRIMDSLKDKLQKFCKRR